MLFLCIVFFNATATTEIYTLSLHDALPIWAHRGRGSGRSADRGRAARDLRAPLHRRSRDDGEPDRERPPRPPPDRKSTRLNSSHPSISYAVFCLKKKTKEHNTITYSP